MPTRLSDPQSKLVFSYLIMTPKSYVLFAFRTLSLDDEVTSREKALKTVVQGQQAENLLDFDEPDSSSSSTGIASSSSNGLASLIMGGGAAQNPATAKILTSSNPLDDLVSIFGNSSMGAPTPLVTSPVLGNGGGMGGLSGFGSPITPTTAPAQPRKPQDDLLDLF